MTLMTVALLALSQTSLEAVIIVDIDPDNDPDTHKVYHDNTGFRQSGIFCLLQPKKIWR